MANLSSGNECGIVIGLLLVSLFTFPFAESRSLSDQRMLLKRGLRPLPLTRVGRAMEDAVFVPVSVKLDEYSTDGQRLPEFPDINVLAERLLARLRAEKARQMLESSQ